MTIAYNHEELEQILGGPLEPLAEEDRLGRACARAICDSVGASHGKIAEVRFSNALYWLAWMQTISFDAGVRHEKQRRDRELRKLLKMEET